MFVTQVHTSLRSNTFNLYVNTCFQVIERKYLNASLCKQSLVIHSEAVSHPLVYTYVYQ